MNELFEKRPKKLCIKDIEKLYIEYDKQSDTLYIHFADPEEEAEEAMLIGDNIVVRIRDGEILGITVMEFMRHVEQQ
ncbi:DUF2283 domain-containing protein [Pyrofollis japonicus]|uniref:DUF2283 domain-containing protein n=1 Tax=Pyrofollis japonicus TaxID=3060460 RepID=UPI00295B36BE|nr:DUF2283 domain-containing protein [Pyrofollis japonicus]